MRDLNANVDRLPHGQRAALQELAQRVALKQLGDEVGRAFEAAELEDGEDVGVVESGGGLCLLLETAQTVGVLRDKGRKNLDGNFAFEDRVAGTVDLAHSAGTERTEDFIAIQPCARG